MKRFLVESNRIPVGVAVRVRGGYRFCCSDARFRSIDSKVFRRARTLMDGVERLARDGRAPTVTASGE